MLLIVLHNRRDYLETLLSIMKKASIGDAAIIEREGLGSSLIGEGAHFIYSKGRLSSKYNRGLISVVEGEGKIKQALDLIENDSQMRLLNLDDRGFVCTVPFRWIKDLSLKSKN